jgi:hypothetical protein
VAWLGDDENFYLMKDSYISQYVIAGLVEKGIKDGLSPFRTSDNTWNAVRLTNKTLNEELYDSFIQGDFQV